MLDYLLKTATRRTIPANQTKIFLENQENARTKAEEEVGIRENGTTF